MGDFLKPWRRRIGVVTLILACVFAALWVRSCSVSYMLFLPSFDAQQVALFSIDGTFAAYELALEAGDQGIFKWLTEASDSSGHAVEKELNYFQTTDEFRAGPVGFATSYLSIVLPLTTLSAFLLLSRPQVKGMTQPVSAERKKGSRTP